MGLQVRGNRKLALVSKNEYEYRVQADDVGFDLLCEIRPVRCDLIRGEKVTVRTHGAISAAAPTVENLGISGDLKEQGVLTVTGDYSGGVEGASEVRWYRVNPDLESLCNHIADGSKVPLVLLCLRAHHLRQIRTLFNRKTSSSSCVWTTNLFGKTAWPGSSCHTSLR